MTEKKPRKPGSGGARAGAGRKTIADADSTVMVSAKMTREQRAKFRALGGSAWLRSMIDAAPALPGAEQE